MEKYLLRLLMICCMLISVETKAQYTFDGILYGAAYYHEYMPTDRLDEDISLMKKAGLTVVRVGESSWGLFEPHEGEFRFEWMDRILDKLNEAGIKVILGTPTYSIPAWMSERHPEILAQYANGGKAYYGIRQNMDFTNPTYLFYSERIIRRLLEHYAKHPAIIGYQVDNETISRGINNHDYFSGFRNYIKKKFNNDLDSLNRAWGLNYWGMNIHSWEEFYARDGVTNPSYKLEWERYGREQIAKFLNWQVDIVNEYKRPDQFVTQCFMDNFQQVDQEKSFRQMQYPGINIYHPVQDGQTGVEIAYAGDYVRTVAKGNYLVTETNAQAIGWDAKGQYPPYDGQLRQNVYSHLASGANMVEYWHWSTLHYGQETYWRGILGQDMEPNRIYNEFSKVADELKQIGKELVNLKKTNKTAILFSHDSYYGLEFMPYTAKENYPVEMVHKALYNMNIEADILPCDNGCDLSPYKMLVIPPLYIASDELLMKIDNFIKDGGTVVMMFKSGYCDEHSTVRAMKAPGPLRNACGFYYQEYSTISPMSLKENPFHLENVTISELLEFLILETARPLAYADHPFLGKWPALTENAYGRGRLVYIATYPSQELLEKIVREEAERIGIIKKDAYRFPIISREGRNEKDEKIHYLFNYSSAKKSVVCNHSGTSLINGRKIKEGEIISLQPWDVLITKE